MKNEPLKLIDLDAVNSLESYIFNLGCMLISVNTFGKLQEKAERLGIFDVDETEKSQTLKATVNCLLTHADDLLRMCTARTGEDWGDLLSRIIAKAKVATKSVETGKKSVAKKKRVKKK